jgi:hypothetical protein
MSTEMRQYSVRPEGVARKVSLAPRAARACAAVVCPLRSAPALEALEVPAHVAEPTAELFQLHLVCAVKVLDHAGAASDPGHATVLAGTDERMGRFHTRALDPVAARTGDVHQASCFN